MIWTIAWRNVWRQGKRSGILMAAIAFGIWAGLLMMALMNGMAEQQVRAAVRTRTSHIQIHAPGFRAHPDPAGNIAHPDSVLATVRRTPGVAAADARVVLTALASSAAAGRGVRVLGVDPTAETRVTDLAGHVTAGAWFAGDRRNPAVIGRRLADKLGVRLGQRIVLTGQAPDGSLAAGAFRVAGIFQTVDNTFDETTVVTRRADLDRVFGLDGRIYEIPVVVDRADRVDAVAAALARELPGLDVATWSDIAPEVALTRDSTGQMNAIFMVVILVALVFGITNTMLMGVLQRTRELGVVIALGMGRAAVFAMVLLETLIMAVVGGAVGAGLGAASVAVLARTGLDLAAVASGLTAFGLDAVVRPSLAAADYPLVVALVVATACVAALYPGWRAVRLDPVRAIRTI